MPVRTLVGVFQFHTGSIKSLFRVTLCRIHRRFNSILVRLKADNCEIFIEFLNKFQFHTGSIKRFPRKRQHTRQIRVSIPYWFD